jgi:hypothetical protein
LGVIAGAARRRTNPLDYSPSLWLDASDSSTMFDATTGGSLVAAGGAVARWEDKSGNANHVTQTDSAMRPTRQTAVSNGRDIVRFDGSNDYLIRNAIPASASDFTVAVVGKHAARTFTGQFTQQLQAYVDNHHTGSIGWVVQTRPDLAPDNTSTRISFAALPNTGNVSVVLPCLANQVQVMVGTREAAGTQGFSLDGTYGSTANATTWALGGASLWIGRWASGRHLQGDICELLIFPSVLGTSDRQALEAYLANKWGVTLG